MIDLNHLPDTNIVELFIDGDITVEEFDEIWTSIIAIIEKYGSIRLLKRIESLGTPPIPMSRLWDDLSLGVQHLSEISHVAVVTDQSWISSLSRIMNPIFKPEVKCFSLSEHDEAREWLKTAE